MERVKEGNNGIYFVYVYENRIMKTVEIVLRKGRGGMRQNDGRGESN
jgi:hypothetical protein